jgi:photosystem II stability/assembly factor-like uncharacterized protein
MNNQYKYIQSGLFLALIALSACKKVIPEVEPAEETMYINLLHSGTTENLRAVQFLDPNTGFALGTAGSLYKTTNAGLRWSKSIPLLQDTSKSIIDTNMVYTKMYFTNNSTGWIVGTYNAKATAAATSATARKTALLKTTDGGLTWTNKNFDASIKTFQDIAFVDESNGYIVGNDGLIYRTFNGGNTWIKQESGVTTILRDVEIIGTSTAMIVGPSGVVLKTTNGGATWEKLNPPSSRAFHKIKFAKGGHYSYAVGGGEGNQPNSDKAFVYKIGTDNSFTDLTNKYYSVFWHSAIHISNDGQTVWTGGHLGQVFRSTNGGETWSEELTKSQRDETIYDMSFPTEQIGYFVGDGGIILKVDLDKK